MPTELQTVAKSIEAAACPEDIFGHAAPTEEALKATYRQLVTIVHPDKHLDAQALAQAAFVKLTKLKAEAEYKIRAGTYGVRDWKPPPPPVPDTATAFSVTVRGTRYVVSHILCHGDVCDLYDCVASRDHDEIPAVLKIAQNAGDNDLVQNESRTLARLFPADAKDEKFYRYLPRLLDSFLLKGAHSNRAVNVLVRLDDYYSLAEVMRAYPSGLDFRDVVWMFKRVLVGIGFAHSEKIVHGAVVPEHVMVHPTGHGAKIIAWSYAVAPSAVRVNANGAPLLSPVKAIVAARKAFYAPEILAKKPPGPETDIYMAAKCAVALLGGDVASDKMPDTVPEPIRRFIASCLIAMPSRRPSHAWELHEEFDALLARVVGKRQYRPLAMPARTT